MWIMTPFGFFSIVCARAPGGVPHKDLRMIRARNRSLLEALCKGFGIAAEIKETTATDYPYRLIVPAALVVEIVTGIAGNIDYDNFKSEAKAVCPQDHQYHDFLATVWGAGLRMTPPGVRKVGGFFDETHRGIQEGRHLEVRAEDRQHQHGMTYEEMVEHGFLTPALHKAAKKLKADALAMLPGMVEPPEHYGFNCAGKVRRTNGPKKGSKKTNKK